MDLRLKANLNCIRIQLLTPLYFYLLKYNYLQLQFTITIYLQFILLEYNYPLYFLELLNESSIFAYYVTSCILYRWWTPDFVQIYQRSNEVFDQQTLRQRINFQLTWKLSNVRMIILEMYHQPQKYNIEQ